MRKMFKVLIKTLKKNDIGFNDVDLCIREETFIFGQDEISEVVERITNIVETKIRQKNWFGGIYARTEIEYSDEEDLHRRAYINIFCFNAVLMIVVDFIEV